MRHILSVAWGRVFHCALYEVNMTTVVVCSRWLFLRRPTQLFRTLTSIQLKTDLAAFYSSCDHCFCSKTVSASISGIIAKKTTVICTFSGNLLLRDALIQRLQTSLSLLSAVSTRSIHGGVKNRSKTPSSYSSHSSTITDTSTTEDVILKDTDMSQFVVGHDKDKKYFYIRLQENTSDQQQALAKLEYEWVRPGLVDLYHTEVPPQFQGKGIAKILATAAFDAFCEQDVLIRPTCTYLQKYLRENQIPRYMDHIEKDFVL